MAYQATFERCEIKYVITAEQKARLVALMAPYMEPDPYGRTTIRNIYFDTENYRLVRRSMEKPAYKEKLRLRSYSRAAADAPVFVELKKKYEDTVYKRRLSMPQTQAIDWLCGKGGRGPASQIGREVEYFRTYYQTLRPAAFLCYERDAYFSRCGDGFRVTFDENILARREAISLDSEAWGTRLLAEGWVLMEVKAFGGMPLWMARALAERQIYKTSFSKYGVAYETIIFDACKGEILHA